MPYCGPRGDERCGYDGTICGGIGDSACIFCSVKKEAIQEVFNQDMVAHMRELKGNHVSENT